MKLFRRQKQRPNVTLLDHVALTERLREFEDRYAQGWPMRLSTQDFYDMYLRGEADDVPFAMEWAAYYELLRKVGRKALAENGAAVAPARSKRSPIPA